MKIKKEHYEHMENAIKETIKKHGGMAFLISQYETGQFVNAEKTKDLSKRFRWDLFHAAGLTKYACDVLYNYMDDTHIDTALRAIVPHKLIKSY